MPTLSLRFSPSSFLIRISTAILSCILFTTTFAEPSASQPATAASQPATNPATLFSLPLKEKKIIFIVEHAGAMLDAFDGVEAEMKRSVNDLHQDQRFTAVYVSEDAAPIFKTLQLATPPTKKDFTRLIYPIRAQGHANGMLPQFQTAFEFAFALKPDAIYFITSAGFDPRLADVIKKLNPKQSVHVNVLVIPTEDKDAAAKLKRLVDVAGAICTQLTDKNVHTK